MTHVTLAAAPLYIFSVYKGEKLGWNVDKFCYKCEGADLFAQQPDIKLSQKSDCSDHIQLTVGTPQLSFILPFINSVQTHQISTYITDFAAIDCGPTTCEFKPAGCGAGTVDSVIQKLSDTEYSV